MSGVMEMAQEILGKAGKPAYVEFSQVAKHMPARSEQEGRYIAVDVDMVTVRQVGSVDSSIFEVTRWLAQNRAESQAGRLPREHADYYAKAYEYWKKGQEMPVEGTPIKGWAMIAPSQQEALIRVGVRTVEDASTMNGEAMQRIGMGAVTIKNMSVAWLAQAKDKGPLTMEMADLKKKNELLELNMAKMLEQMETLQQQAKRQPEQRVEHMASAPHEDISAADLLGDEPASTRPARKR